MKLSDDWYDHSKVLALGDDSDAIALWALGLSRTGRRRKGGYLSDADLADLRPTWRAPRVRRAVDHLVDVGLLERKSGGATFHNHGRYNRQLAPEVVEAVAEGAAEGGRRRAADAVRDGGRFAPKPDVTGPVPAPSGANPPGISPDDPRTGREPEQDAPAESQPRGWPPDPTRPDPNESFDLRVVPSAHEAGPNGHNPHHDESTEATAVAWLSRHFGKPESPTELQMERVREVVGRAEQDARRDHPGGPWQWAVDVGFERRQDKQDPIDHLFEVDRRWQKKEQAS